MMSKHVLAPARQTTWIRLSPQPASLLCPLVLIALVVGFYHRWLQPGPITAGDFVYLTVPHLKDALPFPSLWDTSYSMGMYNILQAPMFPLYVLQGIMALLHLDWSTSGRLVWIVPAVVVPCASTYALALSLFRRHLGAIVGALAIVMNSYAYLLYEGGQFGVAVGYGCIPAVLWAFVHGQRQGTMRSYILTGLVMAVQAMYDIRSTYISLGVVLVYGTFCRADWSTQNARNQKRGVPALATSIGLPQIAVALTVLATMHLWWILPALWVRAPALPAGYTDVAGVHPLSLMQLSNGLSLFHPFWFANNLHIAEINPLFFLVPLVVFGLLLSRRRNLSVLALMTIALIATFLVKGDNDPAGGVYDWLFVHLPGFSFFRDASKFYQPLALSYALLLGVAATACFDWLAVRTNTLRRRIDTPRRRIDTPRRRINTLRRAAQLIVVGIFVMLAIFPAYPALLAQADGTLAVNPIPAEYARFNDFVDRQQGFFRVLWVPAGARFVTASARHPALDVSAVTSCCLEAWAQPDRPWSVLNLLLTPRMLQALSVRYVVVPDDTLHETFKAVGTPGLFGISRAAILAAIRGHLPNLHEFMIGQLHVFDNTTSYPLLFTLPADRRAISDSRCGSGLPCPRGLHAAHYIAVRRQLTHNSVTWDETGGFRYDARVRVAEHPVYLVFQQTYDPNWLAFALPDGVATWPWTTLTSRPLPPSAHAIADGYANAWIIRESGTYHIVLEYWPQRLVLLGLLTAIIALLCYGMFLLICRVRAGSARLSNHGRPSLAFTSRS